MSTFDVAADAPDSAMDLGPVVPKFIGADMQQDQEPAPQGGDATVQAEETAQTTKPKAPEAQAKEGGDGERLQDSVTSDAVKEAERQVSQLGEERKQLLEPLLDSALASESDREKLKVLFKENPRLKKLAMSKFGDKYDRIMSGQALSEVDISTNGSVDMEALKLQVKAETLMEQDAKLKEQQLVAYAESKGFSTDELEKLRIASDKLEDMYDDFTTAIGMAGRIVNESKANAKTQSSILEKGDVKSFTKAPAKVQLNEKAIQIAHNSGVDTKNLGERLGELKERVTVSEDGAEVFSPTIPF